MKTFNLFVYGTLKTTENPGKSLKGFTHADATAVGTMYNIANRYAGVVFGKGDTVIKGQVFLDVPYELPITEFSKEKEELSSYKILDVLDQYEGATSENPLYRRVTVKVKVGDREVDAFAYEAADKAIGCSKGVVDSGDWDEYSKKTCGHCNCKKPCGHHSCNHGICNLTGKECPYAYYNLTGLCRLPEYSSGHPENDVPEPVIKAISGFFNGCMRCDMLSKHYYLCGCMGCDMVEDQLKLYYLAKCYIDRHKEK